LGRCYPSLAKRKKLGILATNSGRGKKTNPKKILAAGDLD